MSNRFQAALQALHALGPDAINPLTTLEFSTPPVER